jgi:hypothetical protein
MNDTPEVYNVVNNNCQHYALRLLDKILRDGRKKMKMLNQTYGQMVEQPIKIRKVKMCKIGEEPPADDDEDEVETIQQKPFNPVTVEEPKKVDDEVVVDDENDDVAVIESEEDHLQMIQEAVAIMIQNTPSIKEGLEAE